MKLLFFFTLCLCVKPTLADVPNPTWYGHEVPLINGLILTILSCTSCFIIALLLHFYVKKKISIKKVFLWLFFPCFFIACLITKAESDIKTNSLCSKTPLGVCDDAFEHDKSPECKNAQEKEKLCTQQHWQYKVLEFFKRE